MTVVEELTSVSVWRGGDMCKTNPLPTQRKVYQMKMYSSETPLLTPAYIILFLLDQGKTKQANIKFYLLNTTTSIKVSRSTELP